MREINNNDKDLILTILEEFQNAYLARDASGIDKFMEDLFIENDKCAIIGTSINEWCLGFDEVKKLFISDWQYWGDLKLKTSETQCIINKETACVYVPAKVKYSFNHNQETDDRYLGFMKSDLTDETLSNNPKLQAVRLQEVNNVLSHYLHQRDFDIRDYYWKLSITITLIKQDKQWKIKQIHFAMPFDSLYPDVRLSELNHYPKLYERECEHITKLTDEMPANKSVNNFLKDFEIDLLSESIDPDTLSAKYFSEGCLVIDTDLSLYDKDTCHDFVEIARSKFGKLKLNTESMLIEGNSNSFWFALNGISRKNISQEEAILSTYAKLNIIMQSTDSSKDKLFKIRREISGLNIQIAYGEKCLFPIRISGLISVEEDCLKFLNIHISFPFDIILEQKTDLVEIEGLIDC